ncbi:MAG: sugar phosphate isomerase/epimerase [Burkholderiales bacterium]|nr:sugar phosphate isomerase/epimerase [Burkholderiales bacterium]
MQRLLVFQSMWAMERRHTDGFESTLQQKLERIQQAGYDGVSVTIANEAHARELSAFLRPHAMAQEWQCFPKSVDDLKPVFELAAKFEVHHLDVQPDVRPRDLKEAVRLVDGWRRLAEQAPCPVYIETHRDRLTTDLYATLDLLDCFPDLKLLGDLSHYLVGREFAWPVSEENHACMRRIIDHCWAFHGRVASREQVQVEISFPAHQPWVELFKSWWRYGFESWRRRAGADDSLVFVCELGPKPYAIIGRDGNDLSDRWEDALLLRRIALDLWAEADNAPSAVTPQPLEENKP